MPEVNQTRQTQNVGTFEAAYYALYKISQLDSPDDINNDHIVNAVAGFLDSHMSMLQKCYSPYKKPSAESKTRFEDSKTVIFKESTITIALIDVKLKDEALKLSKLLEIEEIEALKIVLQIDSKGISDKDLRFEYCIRHFLSERRYLVKLVNLLFKLRTYEDQLDKSLLIEDSLSTTTDETIKPIRWRKYSTEILVQEDFYEMLIQQISDNFTSINITPNDELVKLETSLWHLELMDVCFTSVCSLMSLDVSNSLVVKWLDVIEKSRFFSEDVEKFSEQVRMNVYGLGLLISVSFLNDQEFEVREDGVSGRSYLKDVDTLIRVHEVISVGLIDYGPGSPVLLQWSFILHKLSIFLMGDEEGGGGGGDGEMRKGLSFDDPRYDSFFKKILRKQVIGDNNRLNIVEELGLYAGEVASQALRLGAFNRIEELFDYLPKKLDYANICSGLLLNSLPYVKMTEQITKVIYKVISPFKEVCEEFFSDVFADRAIILSKGKVPYALNPFLILCKCLGEYSFDYIMNMSSYMEELPKGFRDYDFITRDTSGREQRQIELTASLSVLNAREEDGEGGYVLPPGTKGELVSTDSSSGITIVMWNCQYNGWTLLGRLLEENDNWNDNTMLNILAVINSTLNGLITNNRIEDANDLLLSLSAGLKQPNIVELIKRKLEDSFYKRDIEVCKLGIQFLNALVIVDAKKVWPYLGRTKLLERNGRGGYLSIILGAVEIVNNDFEFTLEIINLVTKLVHNCLLNSLDTTSISVKVKSEVLEKFIRHLIDVFESFSNWRYEKPDQRLSIANNILQLFSLIIHSNYRCDVSSKLEDKVTHVLSKCSELITNEFLSCDENGIIPLSVLLGAIESAAKGNIISGINEEELSFISSVLLFSSLLVRVRSILKLPCSQLERKLYSQSSDLVMIFLRYFSLHAQVIDVLQSITGGYWPDEQPSLLAHLGTQYSQILIGCLTSSIRNNLELDGSVSNICDYFSTIIESKQKGLSILLLSGEDTRNTSDKVESVDSLLTVLEEKISSKLPPFLIDKLLNSISLAHNTWTLNAADDKSTLCKVLIDYIQQSNSIVENPSHNTLINESYKISIAAKAITIISIQLYKTPKTSKSTSASPSFINPLLENLIELSKSFLTITGFRSSLHGNLKRNFDTKYPKSPLNKYISSLQLLIGSRPYGINYLYDLGLLETTLSHDPFWSGYRDEIMESNINLSYIDSQMSRVKSWCTFLTSLILSQPPKSTFSQLNTISHIAIQSNLDDNISLSFFRGIIKLRLDLAFFITYHISKEKLSLTTEQQLSSTFKLLADPAIEFLKSPDEFSLYKQLLKIINLQLDNFTKEDASFRLLQTIHGILDVVVIRGMISITNSIQAKTTTNGVEDIIEITTILRKCLKIPGIASLYSNASQLIVDSGCDQAVMGLFAYSLDLNDDPIYGELALIYLLEWLSVDTMADNLVKGLFNVFIESPIARAIQQGNITSTTHPRLFSIWTKGILTIVLELLEQLGSRIIEEVISFLNFYFTQIDNALRYWLDEQPIISLSNIEESYQLYLLIIITKKLADPEQIRAIPKFTEKHKIIDSFDYLLSHQRYLSSRTIVTNAEEQKLFDSNTLVEKVADQLQSLSDFLANTD